MSQENGSVKNYELSSQLTSLQPEMVLQQARTQIQAFVPDLKDQALKKLLFSKLLEGVKVEVIVSAEGVAQQELQLLQQKGALVYQLKENKTSFSRQKFCLIDRKTVLYGSSHWTLRQDNSFSEKALVTDHRETVDRLSHLFEEYKTQSQPYEKQVKGKSLSTLIQSFFGRNKAVSELMPEEDKQEQKSKPETRTEYEQVLDSMIAAEVANFDRSLLRSQGFDRAKANNGDALVLNKALDSVYSTFVNDINVIEDKKKRLVSKIEEQRVKNVAVQNEKLELLINTLHTEEEIEREKLSGRLIHLRAQVAVSEKEIDGIRQHKISACEGKIHNIEQDIREKTVAFVKPAFKWFEFIPTLIVNLALLAYLVLFYSSAAYILIFSQLDAQEAQLRGITPNPPEVFNPEAISLAFAKGGSAPYFIFLFVIVPLALSIIDRFINRINWWKTTLVIFGILIVDAFIAYKVAESIHNVKYLSGDEDELWTFNMVFEDLNFYLVFILGALGLLLFKVTFAKFISIFEERNPDIADRKNQQQIRQLREDIRQEQKNISDFKEEVESLEKKIIQLNKDIQVTEEEHTSLPAIKAKQLEKARTEHGIRCQAIERSTDVYKNHIENDRLPISLDSVKDRINVFLEGWNDFLHEEYAVTKAIEKSKQAAEVANQWQQEKLSGSLDSRIKA